MFPHALEDLDHQLIKLLSRRPVYVRGQVRNELLAREQSVIREVL